MSLAQQALLPLPNVGVPLTCHVATWFWAATEAQALGLSSAKSPRSILQNIVAMNPAAQPEILLLPKSGNWNFNLTPVTPPAGSVLIWPTGGTHSAIITGNNAISGYNQGVQFPAFIPNIGLTCARVNQLSANHMQCIVVAENTIVAKAAQLNL